MSRDSISLASSSNYQSIFDNAIIAYKRKTNKDLHSHPLLAKLETCNSPDAILTLLRGQIPDSDHSRGAHDRLAKWLNPTVNVLYGFSGAIGAGVGMVYPPVGIIFAGISVLFSAAQSVSESYDALARIFDRIENFFRRLETYIGVPPTAGMMDMIVKIMVEVLSIFAILTKEIKQSRARKYVKKLVGKNDVEEALDRLDRLTQEEALMAAAQGLKVTHDVDEKVGAVGDKVQGVDRKVQGVDNKIQGVDGKVQGVDHRVRDVDNKLDMVIDGGEKIREKVQQVADDQKRNQLRKDFETWLSPPDPSVNYNIASDAHHEGTALWFTEGSAFRRWKESESLLWIYGKPGSGKSVLSASIIQDVERDSKAGSAHIAYFFFDFKDQGKKDSHALVSSLVVQLSYQSESFFDVLAHCYSTHRSGSKQPGDRAITQCLQDMLRVPGEKPIYLIIDALDECPSTTGLPPPREKVLELVEQLIVLNIPNLHLCVTSRPEIDIRTSLEPLTSNRISLHDEIGQKQDIADYVRSVVYSDRNMRRWRDEDKELVIGTLSEKADGMFRWVYCQLETLRPCLPPSVRRILDELPETLDGTYERILEEIPKSNRACAHRLLQCLSVSIRPLRVEELAAILAVDFDTTGEVPKFNEDLRWEDQEHAVLSACSSLIAVVEGGYYGYHRVVQFSHFSVKEFLTSDRLATSKVGASYYFHIHPEPAHTIMAQACLGVLLRLDSQILDSQIYEPFENLPLAQYAAEHIGDHAEFDNVFSHLMGGVESLLDADKPHFSAWLRVRGSQFGMFEESPEAPPLYHVAKFGFCNMVEYLISKRPEDLSARGKYGTPLHAALYGGHAKVALLLLDCYSDVDDRGIDNRTPLHLAADHGLLEITRILVERHANVDARDSSGRTPLHPTKPDYSRSFDAIYFDVAQFLLEHGADVNAQDNIDNSTPLHVASSFLGVKVMQLLYESGAKINAQNEKGQTPLHRTLTMIQDDHWDVYYDSMRFLLDHGADVNALDDNDSTPLHVASHYGSIRAIQLLLEHGANLHARDKDDQAPINLIFSLILSRHPPSDHGIHVLRHLLEHGVDVDTLDNEHSTPLHMASRYGRVKEALLLLEHGANTNVRNENDQTPLHLLSSWYMSSDDGLDVLRLFLEQGAKIDALDNQHWTPLHVASRSGNINFVRLLLEHGANIRMRNENGQTPLHLISSCNMSSDVGLDIIRLFLEHGAEIDALDNEHSTPLHVASQCDAIDLNFIQPLLEHGANIHLQNKNDQTPLHLISSRFSWSDDELHVIRFFLDQGADIDALDNENSTPLHLASQNGSINIARLLLKHGANVNARNKNDQTPLHLIWAVSNKSLDGRPGIIRLFLEHGADVNAPYNENSTLLHLASQNGNVDIAQLLLEYGADIHSRNKQDQTPLQLLVAYDWRRTWVDPTDTIRLFLERSGDVNSMDSNHSTLLHVASYLGNPAVVQLLLQHGANINARNKNGQTPLHSVCTELKFNFLDSFVDSIRRLLEHGADVDALDNDHSSALHIASLNGCVRAARLLLKHGASVDLQNNEGQTPVQIASSSGHEELTRFLSEHSKGEKV